MDKQPTRSCATDQAAIWKETTAAPMNAESQADRKRVDGEKIGKRSPVYKMDKVKLPKATGANLLQLAGQNRITRQATGGFKSGSPRGCRWRRSFLVLAPRRILSS